MNRKKVLISILTGIVVVAVVLFATPILGPTSTSAQPPMDGNFTMWAGQGCDFGSGSVVWESGKLKFSITPNPGMAIGCIHVYYCNDVADLPQPPAQGTWPNHFNCTPEVWQTGTVQFEIPFASLPAGWSWPIVIAIHANTIGCESAYQEDTAWACAGSTLSSCLEYPGASWAKYFWYNALVT